MNTEEAWRTWWDAEGKHMERLPHHNAIDHMASVTRIAWLNGAFDAADKIDRLRQERDEARRSVCEMCVELGGVFRRVGGKTVEVTTAEGCAEIMRWDCFKENT